MKISKESWAYRFTYQPWGASPDEVNMFKFALHFLLTALTWGLYWLVVGTICFLFALKTAESEEDFFVPIKNWWTILGHRIWPLSLIGLGFMIWPFIGFNSWIKHLIFPITCFSLYIFIITVFTKKIWEEISEVTKIVFTENGKV